MSFSDCAPLSARAIRARFAEAAVAEVKVAKGVARARIAHGAGRARVGAGAGVGVGAGAGVGHGDSRGYHGDDDDRAVSHVRELVREIEIYSLGVPIYRRRLVGRRKSVDDGDTVDDAVDRDAVDRARACGIGREEVNDDGALT